MLRLRHVAYQGQHPPLALGQLVVYTMGVVGTDPTARRRTIVACADGQPVPLDLAAPRTGHDLFVQWYPYVRDTDCHDRRVQRRAAYGHCDMRQPPARWALAVLGEPDDHLVLELAWDPAPRDGWGQQVTEAAPVTRAIADYTAASTAYYAARALRRCAADPHARNWPGSVVVTPAGTLPMAALTHAAMEAAHAVTPALLRHWCALAVARLQLPHTASRDALIELLCDLSTTRLWALAYQTDTSLGGRIIDDWAHIAETPDAAVAVYDCEDGTFAILSVLASLQHFAPTPHAGWLERLADLERNYVFVQALGRMRSGDTVVWHSYVLGLDRASVWKALKASDADEPAWPSVLIESTQYTTSLWRYDVPSAREAVVADEQGLSDFVHAKIPGSLMRSCGAQQYLQTFALFLPPDLHAEAGGAEVVLHTTADTSDYGVDTAALLARPAACHWHVVPGWNAPALQEALAQARARLPPWPTLSLPKDAPRLSAGGVAFLRPADYALLPARWPYVDLPLYRTEAQTVSVRLVALEGPLAVALRPARKPWKP